MLSQHITLKDTTKGVNNDKLAYVNIGTISNEINDLQIRIYQENHSEQDPFQYSRQLLGKVISRLSSLRDWNVQKDVTIAIYVTIKQ
ncbi:hypothetical protein [uncultured Tenacibaculum sp.]|uniref:hypothetical protein n=1 Tax=uncultured Tenacibaculum sp. TaxID=174713 RepID=UPI002620062C|nr:hypothetical protein [uncultured Tenacibaculum sp.]